MQNKVNSMLNNEGYCNYSAQIIYPNFLQIEIISDECFASVIEKNIENIENDIKNICNNIELEFIKETATYMQGNSSAIFYIKPMHGYKWDDGSNETRSTKIFFPSVVLKNTFTPINDAIAPTNDIYNGQIVLDELTNFDLNMFFESLNVNLSNSRDFLLNKSQYNNVNIAYISQSANIKKKTVRFLVSPNQGFEWKDGTIGSKILVVGLSNVVCINNFDEYSNSKYLPLQNTASTPLCDEWNEKIFINEPSSNSLKNFMNNYKFYILDNLNLLKNYHKYQNIEFAYAGGEEYINSNLSTFNASIKPKFCFAWNNGDVESKIIPIHLKNVYVNNVEYKSKIIFTFDEYTIIKSNDLNSNFINELFNSENIKLICKKILVENPLYKIDYWIEKSKRIINNNTGEIYLGVSPKKGHSWKDKTLDTKKVKIIIKNFFIPELDA